MNSRQNKNNNDNKATDNESLLEEFNEDDNIQFILF